MEPLKNPQIDFSAKRLVNAVRSRVSRISLNIQGALCARRLRPQLGASQVSYFSKHYPQKPAGETGRALGGEVKLTYLQRAFEHSPAQANNLYVVSSVIRDDVLRICKWHKRRGARVILNQNGLYYPAWFGEGWSQQNQVLRALHEEADYVIYQSAFCRRACKELLGVHRDEYSIMHNPVDLRSFYRLSTRRQGSSAPRVLMLPPAPRQYYRLISALGALAFARRDLPECELWIAGVDRIGSWWSEFSRVLLDSAQRFGVPQDAVQLLPRYERQQAPDIFRQGDVFLHPVCNDACPNVVVEALASGLPVVFSQTGGVPELVTSAEGVGVESVCSWEQFTPPPPEDLGAGIVKIFSDYEQYSQRARLRAETHFGVESYLAKHAEIFSAKARGS